MRPVSRRPCIPKRSNEAQPTGTLTPLRASRRPPDIPSLLQRHKRVNNKNGDVKSLGELLIVLCVISLTLGVVSLTFTARRTRLATHRIRSTRDVLNTLSASSPEVDVLLMAMRADGMRVAVASRIRRTSTLALPIAVSSVSALLSALALTPLLTATPSFVPQEVGTLVVAFECLLLWAGVAVTWICCREMSTGEHAMRRLVTMAADDPKAPAAERWKERKVPSWLEDSADCEDDC